MEIFLANGTGSGTTLLSAFDAALQDAGVSNYNLIQLSSVIPPKSQIKLVEKYHTPPEEWGYILYVVKAEQRSDQVGHPLATGIGWYQFDDDKGLFVEHETEGDEGDTEENVHDLIERNIKASLSDLCKNRDLPFDETKVQFQINTTTVKDHPACTLTLAVYQTQSWAK